MYDEEPNDTTVETTTEEPDDTTGNIMYDVDS